MRKPNFVEIVSERFNVSSGDTILAYDVVKLLDDEHRRLATNMLTLIEIMEKKGFYEDIIIDEIKKQLKESLT